MRVIKKHAYRFWANLSLAAIAVVTLLSLAGAIYGLRTNNLNMVELREAVFAADKDNGDIEAALQDLRAHVLAHMNSDLARDSALAIEGEKPIQLTYSYYRASIAEYERVVAATNDSSAQQFLMNARANCEVPSVPVSERISCINQYIADNANRDFPRTYTTLSKDLYTYDFESPTWSPDLAGFSLAIFAVSIVLLTFRFIIGETIARMVRNRNR